MVRKAEVEANKRLHDEGQKYTTLLAKVVPLHAEIAMLKDAAAANQAKMTSLEERSITREVLLGKVKPISLGRRKLLRRSKLNLRSGPNFLRRAKRSLQRELKPSPELKKRRSLKPGFSRSQRRSSSPTRRRPMVQALSQVACKHPEVDTSFFATANHVVDGEIAPRVLP